MKKNNTNFLNQAQLEPIEELALIKGHITLVSASQEWTDVAIFIDENEKALLVLMLQNDQVVSMLRFCLSVDDSVNAIDLLNKGKGQILLGSYQGEVLTREEIHSIPQINAIWNNIPEQHTSISSDDVREFFQRIEDGSKKTGRGKGFSSKTRHQVMHDSHGRCMFTGCGDDLGFEEITGTEGNFSYLAHNIASAEKGERGVIKLSEKLSDDPRNVLLLCDKHHRLIDKVAAVDFPAHRLSKIRRDFCTTADKLLEGLSYQPIPVFAVLWPVHRAVISAPTKAQVAQSLATIKCRIHSQINDLSDNESLLRDTDTDISYQMLSHSIKVTADKIKTQAHASRYNIGLFALGLMPPLIALGALLGNKNNITPMLRYRDSGQWIWPLEEARKEFYTVSGMDNLTDNESQILMTFAFTAEPESLIQARNEIAETLNAKHIIIKALPEYMGNGALGHPEDGYALTSDMQILMITLKDKYKVDQVHLFPCASNAACIFLGQAYDSHHPDILLYDFHDNQGTQTMRPVLNISNVDNRCEITHIDQTGDGNGLNR